MTPPGKGGHNDLNTTKLDTGMEPGSLGLTDKAGAPLTLPGNVSLMLNEGDHFQTLPTVIGLSSFSLPHSLVPEGATARSLQQEDNIIPAFYLS